MTGKRKEISVAPLRIRLRKSGNFVMKQTDTDKLQKIPDNVGVQKDLKKAQEAWQKTGQKNLNQKKMEETGEEGKNQREHHLIFVQDEGLTGEAQEPSDDDFVSGSSSKS